ncbi:MAG TPA: hypothetical protein VF493_01385 [Terriglobales bacterium]
MLLFSVDCAKLRVSSLFIKPVYSPQPTPSERTDVMRCLLKVSIPVEAGNAAISDGTLPRTIESIINELKPEAAYFAEDSGKRTGFIFFDLKDTSQIPAVAEPWFLAFNAQVEFHPAMNLGDLKKATPGIEKAVKNYYSPARAKAA